MAYATGGQVKFALYCCKYDDQRLLPHFFALILSEITDTDLREE